MKRLNSQTCQLLVTGFNQEPKHTSNSNNKTLNTLPPIRYVLFRIPKQRLQRTDNHPKTSLSFEGWLESDLQMRKIQKDVSRGKTCQRKNARSLFQLLKPKSPVERLFIKIHMQNQQLHQRHNTLLHREKTAPKSNSVTFCNKQQARTNDEAEVFTTKANCSAMVQVVPVTVHSLSQKQTVYALLDSGSTSSFMSPQLAKMLELKPMETSDVIIGGFNSQKNHSTKSVQFQISDANDSERFNCQNILVVENFQLPKLKEHPTDIIRKYPPSKWNNLDNTR